MFSIKVQKKNSFSKASAPPNTERVSILFIFIPFYWWKTSRIFRLHANVKL